MTRTYTVAGTSVVDGECTFRLCNIKPKYRAHVLRTRGHTEINLFELPAPMTQDEAIEFMQARGMSAIVPRRGRNAAKHRRNTGLNGSVADLPEVYQAGGDVPENDENTEVDTGVLPIPEDDGWFDDSVHASHDMDQPEYEDAADEVAEVQNEPVQVDEKAAKLAAKRARDAAQKRAKRAAARALREAQKEAVTG